MSDWPSVTVGEICRFKYGKSLPASKRSGGDVGVFGSNGVIGYHDQSLTAGPTIVVGRKGSVGEVNYSTAPCWPIDTTYYIDSTSTDADLRWLVWRLGSLDLGRLNKAAAVPGLNRDDAYQLRVILPPRREQQRIAEVLDRAEAVRAKRREALARLDELTQSLFLDMFGERESSLWCEKIVADVAGSVPGSIRTGPFGSQLLHEEFVDDGIAVLGIDNVVSNEFTWSGRRFITAAKYRELKRYTVHPGDVLITIMGTCGRCAVVPDDIPLAINTKHLCCITLDQGKCLPAFLRAYFLMHPRARRYLTQTAKGAIMSGLNMGIIKSIPIRLPPIDLQREFARRVEVVERIKAVQRGHLAGLDELFGSLQDRAFGGTL